MLAAVATGGAAFTVTDGSESSQSSNGPKPSQSSSVPQAPHARKTDAGKSAISASHHIDTLSIPISSLLSFKPSNRIVKSKFEPYSEISKQKVENVELIVPASPTPSQSKSNAGAVS